MPPAAAEIRSRGTFRFVPSRRPSAERVRAALQAQLAELAGAGAAAPPAVARDAGELQPACVQAVLAALDANLRPHGDAARIAVRYLLDRLAAAVPGRAVEVRVPPYGAVQCMAGPSHTRGTPPNVVETDPATWLRLATGRLAWQEALRRGQVRASGPRADLSPHLPISRLRA